MNFSAAKYSIALSISSALLLGACGGGGGGDTAGSNNNGTMTASSITSSNAQDVAAQTMLAAEGLNSQSGAGGSLAAGVSIDASRKGLVSTALQQLYKGLESQPASSLVAGITTSQSFACTNGGSVSVTVNAAVSGTVSNGDSMSISAANCIEGAQKMNGTMTFGFSNLSGTIGSSSAWSGTLSLTFANVSLEENGEVARANGDMTLRYSQTGYLVATASASGASLQMVQVKNGATVADETLTNFSYDASLNANVTTYSVNFTLSGTLGKLGNSSYTVKTLTPFKETDGAYPSSGSVKITAGDNSTAIVTAVDSANVRIELDKNGDGVIDETINTTWVNLDSRL